MPSRSDPSLQTHLLSEAGPSGSYENTVLNDGGHDDDDVCVIILRPIGQRAVNGLYSSYDPTFPAELKGVVPQVLFEKDMEHFNHRLQDYWPCPFCFGFGYCCAICTLGMSFYCPSMCVSNAVKFGTEYFDQQANSRAEYYDRQLKFRLVRACCTSWVEVSYRRYDHRKKRLATTRANTPSAGIAYSGYGTVENVAGIHNVLWSASNTTGAAKAINDTRLQGGGFKERAENATAVSEEKDKSPAVYHTYVAEGEDGDGEGIQYFPEA